MKVSPPQPPVRSWVVHNLSFGLMLPHARASSRQGYDPDGPVVMAPFRGSNSWSFLVSAGDPEQMSVVSPSSIVTAGSGSMMKWWVAAPSGPEKLDDGEPRRSGKTTTITHLTHTASRWSRARPSRPFFLLRPTKPEIANTHAHTHAHHAGTNRCLAFKEALQEMTNRRTNETLELKLNHCEAAHDLPMQNTRELELYLVLIAETYGHRDSQFWELDNTNKAVIWSCGKLPFQDVVSNREDGFVAAWVDGIRFYSCYSPPSLSIEQFLEFLDRLTEDAGQYFPVAIAGDFNSWAVDWGRKFTNVRGKVLLEEMATLDVVPLNIGNTPTYTNGGANLIVELTFVYSSLTGRSHCWKVFNSYIASDHSAIRWKVSTGQNRRRGWKVKSFDPAALMVALNCEAIIIESAEEKTENLMKRVTQACDASVSRKWGMNQRRLSTGGMITSPLFVQSVSKKEEYLNVATDDLTAELVAEYKKARRELNKAIKDSKKRCWKELVEEVKKDP
ncbi:hypothetical protein EVAR_78672_1 [Eumeta japonica]|uniref:Endonuclease/exonuclease/phosphatase domain-containing protein n=1 Tax=Eumeta variegata TaxID=151549 RepID=A0A4C1U988_EUMVA|nr:hypothetical protein EVAR_78672_1 [Eumeta japonica]